MTKTKTESVTEDRFEEVLAALESEVKRPSKVIYLWMKHWSLSKRGYHSRPLVADVWKMLKPK